MSQGNSEMVRRAFDAIDRGDYADAEWHNTSAFPGDREVLGPPAIMDFWRTLLAEFDSGGMEVERLAESGDSVVADVHSWGRGSASRVPVDVHWGVAVRLRDGRIARVDVYGDYARALEAAKLSG
jgi:ketosteroid isomerase-like protein